jgi:toxin ParE1/3/4
VKRLVVLRQARVDLEEIRDWSLAGWGLPAWEKRARLFDEAFERIQTSPATGRDRGEYLARMRSVSVKPHVIFFREDAEVIVILRVLDDRRDLPNMKYAL